MTPGRIKKKMENHNSLLKIQANDGMDSFLRAIGVSISAHFLLVAILVVIPRFNAPPKHIGPAIQVDLVAWVSPEASRPSVPGRDRSADRQPAVIPAKKKSEAVRKPETIKAVDVPANDKNVQATDRPPTVQPSIDSQTEALASVSTKHALKKMTYQAGKVAKKSTADRQAVRQPEKNTAKSSPEASSPKRRATTTAPAGVPQDVFDRIRANVAKDERRQNSTDSGGTVGSGSGGVAATIQEAYLHRVKTEIERNWAFSGRVAGAPGNLHVSLFFKIMPNGEIRDIVFETRSGNEYLDESAYKAIIKSNPVSPHPPGINKPVVVAGYRFTPSGME